MADAATAPKVWIRSLGAAWKVRAESTDVAEQVRRGLIDLGWKCTMVTAAFDVRNTVLFRATDATGHKHRPLDDSVRTISGVSLMDEPA